MSGPVVSVVIPTRNRLGLLAQTLHTVLTQDVDLEVIVVDEASEDETPRWLAAHTDGRVRTVRHDTPRGLSEARNSGIAAARGRWLGFVDDDDLWMPSKLAGQLAAATDAGAPWAFSGGVVFREGPRLLQVNLPSREQVVQRLPRANWLPAGGSNAIVSREVLDQIGGFDPSLDSCEDWDMWLRLLQVGEPAMAAEPLVAYRIHGRNMSGDHGRMFDGIQAIEERYRDLRDGESVDWQFTYDWMRRRALRSGNHLAAARIAWRSHRAGHPDAERHLLRALLPISTRDPVADPSEANGLLDRVRRRTVVRWPPGVKGWLQQVLDVTP